MSTIVKQVNGTRIMLEEDNYNISDLYCLEIILVLIAVMSIAAVAIIFTNYQQMSPELLILLVFTAWLPIIIICVVVSSIISVPGYRVWVDEYPYIRRYIKKTTSERDQKEICRIVLELERDCIDKDKKEREKQLTLKQIAEKCK